MNIDTKLAKRLEKINSLPSPPRVAMKIIEAARDPDISLAGVAEVVMTDPAISAKIMRVANSAAYSRPGGCNTLRRALLTLGLDATLIIALSFSLVISLKRAKLNGLDHGFFWRRSLLSATAASALARALHRPDREALFLAGLLQDIGMLAIDKCEPGLYAQAGDVQRDHRALARLEMDLLNCDHAAVGVWLLERWQLPQQFLDAVASSHDPQAGADDSFARCIALTGPLADVWLSSDWSYSFRELVVMAVDNLGLDHVQLSTVLDELREQIPETESMFEKDLVTPGAGFGALDEAREMLMERGVDGFLAEKDDTARTDAVAPVTLVRLEGR